jgi:two-component system phosphate regulon sensor histidine kinase PhoR
MLRKFLLTALVLIAVALVSADSFLSRYTSDREFQHAAQLMEAQTRLLLPSLAATGPQALQDWSRQSAPLTSARVTIINRDGSVLADSEHDTTTMDNHAGRPEVRDALAGNTGKSVRHSATLDVDLCYLAVPASIQPDTPVILRLSVPLARVSVSIWEVRWLIVRASLIAAVFALGIAFFASRAFARRIHRIETFAGDLVNADYSGTIAIESDDELGSVARSLRHMAEQFRGMMQRLSGESARRNAILSSMVEGVLAVDADLRITFCNESFLKAIHASQPLEGVQLLAAIRDPLLLDLIKQVVTAGEPARKRLSPIAAKDRVFDVQAVPLEIGAQRGALAILHDVTQIERLERVRKDFVANISHELRTPLAAIHGYAETLLDHPPDDPQQARRFLEIICANAGRLGDMASDLLALAELDSEREGPPAERLSVDECCRAAAATVQQEAERLGVNVILNVKSDLSMRGQSFRLEHALVNLLQNAIRYNRRGGDVHIDAQASNSQVRIIVHDHGIGIPAADLPRIFERFYCVDKARSRKTGGTGLGLAIVKHLVERMNGSITVESELGSGTTFTLAFPASAAQSTGE